MPRLALIQTEATPGRAQDLLSGVKKKLGLVPNLTRVLANSPAALEGYLAFSGALATGCTMTHRWGDVIYQELQLNRTLDRIYARHAAGLGRVVPLKTKEADFVGRSSLEAVVASDAPVLVGLVAAPVQAAMAPRANGVVQLLPLMNWSISLME